jgi:hypothetical protein
MKALQINCSLKIHKTDTSYAPDVNHQNIFELTQAVVKGTQCTVNVVLCARVALMVSSLLLLKTRSHYLYSVRSISSTLA